MCYVESAALASFLVYCGEQKVWGGGIVYNDIIIKVTLPGWDCRLQMLKLLLGCELA